MHAAELIAALPELIMTGWGRTVRSVSLLEGGMNSTVAAVELDRGRYVAKWVPEAGAVALDRGSAIADRLSRAGLPTGAPLPTAAGAWSAPASTGRLALLRMVDGAALTGVPDEDQREMAETLARVHRTDLTRRRAPFLPRLADEAVPVEPWVVPQIRLALADYDQLPAVQWGLLHTDPCPDAFRRDPASGTVGLIDWTGASHGPLLYDVASAVMYLGGAGQAGPFLICYAEAGPLSGDELELLPTFTRLRAAVQASYFSARIARQDLTGIDDQQDNWKGLADARAMFG